LCRVFDETSVTSLAIAKLTLDDSELMLDFGPNRGFQVLELFDGLAHPLTLSLDGFALGRLHSNMPSGFDVLQIPTGVSRYTYLNLC
jgi:hypothetical protein